MKTIFKNIWYSFCIFMACMALAACTKYDTPEEIAAGLQQVNGMKQTVKRYVLWVNIDGASGSLVKQEVENGTMPTLKSMLSNSKYMWSGIADDHSIDNGKKPQGRTEEDPVTWTSMLTGVNSNLHRVNSYSYTPEFDVDNNKASYFPNIVQYLSQKDPSAQMSCVSPWEHLNKYLSGMHSIVTTSGDDETLSTLVKQLTDNNYRLTITSFRGVQDAGKAGGFTLSNADYVNSLKKVDESLKQLLATINARPNLYYEDWMVCVTSDHGGTADGEYGSGSDSERDIFGVFYYPHYTALEMKGSTFEAVRLPYGQQAMANDKARNYVMATDYPLAVELVMRNNANASGSYDNGGSWNKVFGKDSWGLFRQHAFIDLFNRNITGGTQEHLTSYNDALCHTCYFGYTKVDLGRRNFVIAYDGVAKTQEERTTLANEKDTSFLTLHGPYNAPLYMAAARIWRKQLNGATMGQIANMVSVPEKYRSNLVGEWVFSPDRLVNDTIIPNTVKGMPDFIFKAKPTFVKIANTLPGMLANNQIMMENTLVLPQIMYWFLGVGGVDSRMEGYLFLSKFKLEEQWRDE